MSNCYPKWSSSEQIDTQSEHFPDTLGGSVRRTSFVSHVFLSGSGDSEDGEQGEGESSDRDKVEDEDLDVEELDESQESESQEAKEEEEDIEVGREDGGIEWTFSRIPSSM